MKHRSVNESPANSDFSHIRPSVQVKPNYPDVSFNTTANVATIEMETKPKRQIKRKKQPREQIDDDFNPDFERKRPTRKAARVAAESNNLLANVNHRQKSNNISLSQASQNNPAESRLKVKVRLSSN